MDRTPIEVDLVEKSRHVDYIDRGDALRSVCLHRYVMMVNPVNSTTDPNEHPPLKRRKKGTAKHHLDVTPMGASTRVSVSGVSDPTVIAASAVSGLEEDGSLL